MTLLTVDEPFSSSSHLLPFRLADFWRWAVKCTLDSFRAIVGTFRRRLHATAQLGMAVAEAAISPSRIGNFQPDSA